MVGLAENISILVVGGKSGKWMIPNLWWLHRENFYGEFCECSIEKVNENIRKKGITLTYISEKIVTCNRRWYVQAV